MRKLHLCISLIILATLTGTVVSRAQCDAGWTLGNHTYLYCYRVSSVRMSWKAARAECTKFDAFLLRIYDTPTWQDVQTITNTTSTTRWWTGLNDQAAVGDWVFDIKAYSVMPDTSMLKFLVKPDDTNHLQNCGALTYVGTVSDERCGDKHRYICEYAKPQGRPCAQSWMNYTTGCYLFPSGPLDPFSMLTWSDANIKCSGILAGTPDASIKPHLLFISTQDELNYIRNTLPLLTETSEIWWIGMSDIATEGTWIWTDGTPATNDLAVWEQEPDNLGGIEKCAYMNRAGLYGDLNCANKEAYICQKETPDSNEFPALGCPGRWMRAGRSCYLLEYANKKGWQDAKTACQQSGAHLLSVDNPDEKMWLDSQSSSFKIGYNFWTGLNNQGGGSTWYWSNGAPANMSLIQWNSEPNNFLGSEDCGTLNRQGFINDMGCLSKKGFICEMNLEDAGCPAGWVSYPTGDQVNCYFFSNTTGTVDEAHAQCNTLAYPGDAYLAAFNNKAELTFLQKQVKAQPNSSIYEWFTGLTDRGHEGFWTYDTTFNPIPNSSLLPWGKWPAFQDGSENCVAMWLGGVYLNTNCQRKYPYICEKLGSKKLDLDAGWKRQRKFPIICEKLASGVSSRGSRIVHARFSMSSVFVLMTYFLVYGICLHYILHLTYVLSPSYAYL